MKMEVKPLGGKKTKVSFKDFEVITDQPKEKGGENTAPTPFDFFFVAIGSCVGSSINSFCQTRGIPTQDLRIYLEISRNSDTKRVEKVDISIGLPEDFPENYQNAALKSAEACTVKKHIIDPPIFNTYLLD